MKKYITVKPKPILFPNNVNLQRALDVFEPKKYYSVGTIMTLLGLKSPGHAYNILKILIELNLIERQKCPCCESTVIYCLTQNKRK